MDINEILGAVRREYAFAGDIISYKLLPNGHINDTYRVQTSAGEDYIVQRVNSYVFHDPVAVMDNIRKIGDYLASKPKTGCRVIDFHINRQGRNYLTLDGGCWRVCDFVRGTVTYEQVGDPSMLCSAGYAFGDFAAKLAGLPAGSLAVTIPDFHNTEKRLTDFFDAVSRDECGRADGVQDDIAFFADNRARFLRITELWKRGEIPERVVHNDTKYNNILIDPSTGLPVCVVDLDTVMPGLVTSDFGDAVRFAANTAEEDETDLSKVSLNLAYFEQFARGYLRAAGKMLTASEKECLALSAPTITFELASRFLADYLDGDKYFHIAHPGHNLERARCQIALCRDMTARLPQMEEIVKKYS